MVEPDELSSFSAAVLDLVDRIPSGRVMTYGSIADALGRGGARGVGTVMARHGQEVPWWRVVRASGSLVAYLMIEAQVHWHREGTPLTRGVVDVGAASWSPR